MESLLALTPAQFEELVAEYLRTQGYRDVERVGGAGDRGVDIRCRDEHGRLVVVQCKRRQPSNTVTGPEVRTFFGEIVDHAAATGIFVTTSRFTRAAIEQAQRTDIELIDGKRIGAYHAQLLAQRRPAEATRPEQPPPIPPLLSETRPSKARQLGDMVDSIIDNFEMYFRCLVALVIGVCLLTLVVQMLVEKIRGCSESPRFDS
jgi:hypothetical protein